MKSYDTIMTSELLEIERKIFDRESIAHLGRFSLGEDVSRRIGFGVELDGIRDYMPGDDARHIDWVDTAKRTDGNLSVRQHYEDQEPLIMVVSDMPSHLRYAETVGDPLSARTLGLIATHVAALSLSSRGSPIGAIFSDGFESTEFKPENRVKTAERMLEVGAGLAGASTEGLKDHRKQAKKRHGLRRQKQGLMLPEHQPFSEVIDTGKIRSKKTADVARFIIVSDFRSDTDASMAAMKKLKKTNDVVAIQITNPVMRGVVEGIDRYTDALGKTTILETSGQKSRFTELVVQRQADIDEALEQSASLVITIDTGDPTRVTQLAA